MSACPSSPEGKTGDMPKEGQRGPGLRSLRLRGLPVAPLLLLLARSEPRMALKRQGSARGCRAEVLCFGHADESYGLSPEEWALHIYV